ncbi:AlpA family phage regulatory protein [Pseudidiomarina sp. 1APR75-33.1]|uniref:helix-turn-helix transcriptional regulator n=1 Tax=Pseudidiomarina terrestris TaxID=2820060 RepID=UPI00264BA60D|nr:AlpA family phage regulatory protein [Pseudidiomarina sp. 1APR75-33.1]MDN7127394.1 AlpA family phage regulatory protein [Pseudidiomarina sp. 1APR75-33.1]
MPKILKSSDLAQVLSVSESTLFRMRKDPSFPKPKQIHKRCVGWLDKDIEKWLEQCPAA